MTPTYPPTTIHSNLTNHPRTAELIGYYFAEFALMEMGLHHLFAHLLRDENGGGMVAILGQIQSFSQKLQLIIDYAMVLNDADEEYKLLKELEPAIKEVTKFRNAIAHGVFGSHPTDPMNHPCVLFVNSLNKSKMQSTPLTEGFMLSKIAELNSINFRLRDFIQNPPRQYTGEPSPKADPNRHRN